MNTTISRSIPFIHNGRIIEGIQFTGDNYKEVRDFIGHSNTNMDIYTIRIKDAKKYTEVYALNFENYNKNKNEIVGFVNSASMKEIKAGDWIFNNRGRFYSKPDYKVSSIKNFIPLYKQTDKINSIDLPIFEGSNVEYLEDKDTGKVYKAIRYTGKNIDEIKNHINQYSDSINTPPSIYGYLPDFRFDVFECSIEKDVYNPIIVIITTSIDGEIFDEDKDTIYMYPGDYILLGLDEFCCETYDEKLYNRLKKRYKVVTKSNGIRLFVVKEDAEYIDKLINFFSNLKKIDYDEYKYDIEMSAKNAVEMKEFLHKIMWHHSGRDCMIRTYLKGDN